MLNQFDYKQFCGMAAMAERLYCADFSRTGKQKYSQQESKVRKVLKLRISISLQKLNSDRHLVLHKTLLLHDLQSEIEVADFDRLLAKIEHVPIEHQEMRTLLIKVLSHIIRRLLTSKILNTKVYWKCEILICLRFTAQRIWTTKS